MGEAYIFFKFYILPSSQHFKISPTHLLAMTIARTGSDSFESHLFAVPLSTCAWTELQNGQQARETKIMLLNDLVGLFHNSS